MHECLKKIFLASLVLMLCGIIGFVFFFFLDTDSEDVIDVPEKTITFIKPKNHNPTNTFVSVDRVQEAHETKIHTKLEELESFKDSESSDISLQAKPKENSLKNKKDDLVVLYSQHVGLGNLVDYVVSDRYRVDTFVAVGSKVVLSSEEMAKLEEERKKREAMEQRDPFRWLVMHQETDGHWSSARYEGSGTQDGDLVATSASLLGFMNIGHTDKAGRWKKNVSIAMIWLLNLQKEDGSWSKNNYVNALCALATAEMCGMGLGNEGRYSREKVRECGEKATAYLLSLQNEVGFFDEEGRGVKSNMLVTGMCVMALKSALLSDLYTKEIKETFKVIGEFLDECQGTGDIGESSQGIAWFTPGVLQGDGTLSQAETALIRQYIGMGCKNPWLIAAAKGQIKHLPTEYTSVDFSHLLFSFLVMFQMGGTHWKQWEKPVKGLLAEHQRLDGDYSGSWDPNQNSWLSMGGRIASTAIAGSCMDLYPRNYVMRW